MEPNIDFNLVRSQKLLLIPQLKQALEILGMNSQELFHYVEEQLEQNPFLECITEDRTYYYNDTEDADYTAAPEEKPSSISLKEHLLLQLNSACLDKNQTAIAEYLIDNTDENGYLNADICEVGAFFNTSAAKVVKVLKKLQGFDPPGICARNLKECLLIQLADMENTNRDAVIIVRHHIDKLAGNDTAAVAAETGISEERVKEAFRLIRTLEPRPGREFYKADEDGGLLVADIIVRDINGKYEAILNEEAFPEVNMAEGYKPEEPAVEGSNADSFVKDGIKDAIWLIKCIEQRKNIILQIADCIIKEQQEFFEKGAAFIRTVSRQLLAETVNMHESVLTQALNGKYLQCRWGIFELKHFYD